MSDIATITPDLWPWFAGVGVRGVYPGINPAMGWLFAVALGLQERRRSAVLRALPFIALGHEASVGVVVLLVTGLQFVAAPDVLRAAGALALIAFGVYKFVKPRSHPRWVGLRVTSAELVLWSFLMSTAHGAGLMLFPVLVGLPGGAGHDHSSEVLSGVSVLTDAAAIMIHSTAMLVAMGLV